MSAITDVQQKVQQFATENAPTLLTAGAVVGTVATGVLAGRAGFKAHQIIAEHELDKTIDEAQAEMEERGEPTRAPATLSTMEKLVLVGPHFIPPVLTGGVTIAAVVFANRISGQKAAALAAAYGLSKQQFEEYREKVAEKLTGAKKTQVTDELAQERANRTPGSGQIVIVDGGDVLCFDQPTGRYFRSTMEKIKRAENKTNEEIIHGNYASANFFYEELGLPDNTWGDEVGWNQDNMLELEISAIVSPDDESTPCIAINFRRMPDANYIRRTYE